MSLSLLISLSLIQPVPTDTLKARSIDEVVVTATRTERPMGALPLPVSVISRKQIQQMGSLRLNDVLREQTGLAVVTDHGQGIQVQGFGPDYTLILVDGEPIVGRTAGTLDLTRLAVGNIKQIEVVKGPSSSLYGSEALAGVVNIITQTPGETTTQAKGSLSARYGANKTSDFSGDINKQWAVGQSGKLGVYVFGNRYQSAGYSLTEGSQTVAPFTNYTGSGRLTYTLSPRVKLSVSGRFFSESQSNEFIINPASQVSGPGTVRDYSLNPVLTHQLSPGWKMTYRYYRTGYFTETNLRYTTTQEAYDASFFRQTFNRPEIVVERIINPKNILTAGTGFIAETVEATRYTERKQFNTTYGFAQYEWMPTLRWTVIAGGRYDAHSQYASQFSPKLSARYALSPAVALRGSVGVGFKAPDFRQLYLNFDNAVAGYSVFGTQEAAAGIARLTQQGQIAEVVLDPARLSAIRAERSVAYNLGAQLKSPVLPLMVSVNLFRNDVRDLIETQVIARKTNGQNIFSYNNLNRVFTQGAELESSWRWSLGTGYLTISGGYQYLVAKDKAVVDGIDAGTVYRRNPETLGSERVKPADYGGLFNRSRHMANGKLFYEHPKKGLSASLRGIYRGRYGFADRDGNLILDSDPEYVRGYILYNLSAAKTWKTITLQAGIDNLTGYSDPAYIPNLAGRLWYTTLRWAWKA
ncbi:TonB-dependent receptor plug domain-containing protein [Spirosoma fluviale]|uniref:Outer membrane receptor for ferrienterochelin and colicins n=1 Tax=Spirosoma fluviale TaxID=1597977 RepID=A0A286GA76_9BACT|nr:TonB-dependent receptor [Spirosoma fluviale]SOD92421.1 outer membrane receptor for ferrienterochelin and colicins [Spirosoma fluviale]